MSRRSVLLVDNYDSFTYNLAQALLLLGAEVQVVENDRATLDDLVALDPTHVVISPGPGTPERPEDLGISRQAIAHFGSRIPTLGVCLGHQAIAHQLGGRILRAPEVRHGKPSPVHHDGTGLFVGLPDPLPAMRYHSLTVDPTTVPASLRITAQTADGVIMGLVHREWPLHGVQFHPESIGTPAGPALLSNFLDQR